MKRGLLGVALLVLFLNELEAFAEIVLEAKKDLWVREIQPDSSFENDWLSVWGADTPSVSYELARYGGVEFDLSGVTDQIVGARIELYALRGTVLWTLRHNSTAFSQRAFLLSPHGIDSLTWNNLAAYSEEPLESLGAYNLPENSPVDRYYASGLASLADAAKLETLRAGTGLATFLFKPIATTGAREWGDREAAGYSPRLVLQTASEPVFLPSDADKSGTVDVAGLTLLLNNYNKTGMVWANGDFNFDGSVNVADLTALLNNYSQSSGLSLGGSEVPEPSSIAMLAGIALTALLCCRVKPGS